jgi:hypothetical protein
MKSSFVLIWMAAMLLCHNSVAVMAGGLDTCRVVVYQPSGEEYVDLGSCDTVRIGCPVIGNATQVGDSIAIPFYVWSDMALSVFSLGFSYNSDFVEITSWSTEGSVIPPGGIQQTFAQPDQNRFLARWVRFDVLWPIPANQTSQGALFGTLYMRILPGASAANIDIDSAFVGPAGEFILEPLGGDKVSPFYTDCGAADVILTGTLCGDVNASGGVDLGDIVYLMQYIFADGQAPNPLQSGDVNCDGRTNIGDAVYLVSYVFLGGAAPCAGCK